MVALLLSFTALLLAPTDSAISNFDYRSKWLKVTIVNLKSGQSPISIAINEMSKRKSPALVAFHSGSRLLGKEAAGLATRFPKKVYSPVCDLIAKPFPYIKALIDSLYLPFDLVEDARGPEGFQNDDGVTVFTAEELAVMMLRYGMHLVEFHSKVTIKDAVLTVQAYFGQAELRGLMQAAELAGINVLAQINEHTGAALQYGIDKDFSNVGQILSTPHVKQL